MNWRIGTYWFFGGASLLLSTILNAHLDRGYVPGQLVGLVGSTLFMAWSTRKRYDW